MSIIDSNTTKDDITKQLEFVQQKKIALQRLIKLTSNLSRLNQGLQSVLILGRSTVNIPPKIMKTFKALSHKLEVLTTSKLKNTLTMTEIKIQNDIKKVLLITQKNEAELSEYLDGKAQQLIGSTEESFNNYVNEFKNNAFASISIRIVLSSRKTLTSNFTLPVPENFIKNQIKILDKRETNYRKKIKHDMTSMITEVTNLINHSNCSDELKQQLDKTKSLISDNIDYFNSGKNIENMPIMFETIEISAVSSSTHPVEVDKLPDAIDDVLATVENTEIQTIKRNKISLLWEWLVTPLDHTWNKIDKNK